MPRTPKSKRPKDLIIERIEKHLSNYYHYQTGIKNAQMALDYLLPGYTANYELMEGKSGSFNFKSSTETAAIDRIESRRARNLLDDLEIYSLLVNSIDNAMKDLDETEKMFIEYRYFKKWNFDQISYKMDYTQRNLFHIKERALNGLYVNLKSIAHIDI